MNAARSAAMVALAGSMLAAASGCVFAYHHGRHGHVVVGVPEYRTSRVVVTHEVYGPPGTRVTEVREVYYVAAAPPAVIVEAVPLPPSAIHVWAPGYWHYRGGRYVWAGGAYIVPPHRRAVWVPGHHARGRRGWRRVRGHWR